MANDPQFSHWLTVDCNTEKRYVCKGPSSPDNPKPKTQSCDIEGFEDFVPFRDDCYWQSTESLSWEDARKACLQKGAHLTSVLDWNEQYFIYSESSNDSFWIGLDGLEVNFNTIRYISFTLHNLSLNITRMYKPMPFGPMVGMFKFTIGLLLM